MPDEVVSAMRARSSSRYAAWGLTRRMDAPIQPVQLRKKPVSVEAVPFDGTAESATLIIDWIHRNGGTATLSCKTEPCPGDTPGGHTIAVQTLEGTMHASSGWWVIRGVEGEFYPCKHSVVETSYDVTEPPTSAVPPTEEQQEYADACVNRELRELLEDEDGAPYPDEVQNAHRFFLWRETDITEVTVQPGEGPQCVAAGIEFADGKVALWWRNGSVAVWDDISQLRDTHLHGRSQTRLIWVD